MFVVAHKIGGQAFGAYLPARNVQRLIGYVLALPGDRNGHVYLHSHMLAVDEAYRNAGVGRLLKLQQRQDALSRRIDLIEWTFDPLEIKNAYFNMERLGAIARRYVPNQYGITSSKLHGGLPTDRLVAEWWLRSQRVERLLAGEPLVPFKVEERVTVPAEIQQWKQQADERAERVQTQNRQQLQRAFSAGLAVLAYEREGGSGRFLLGKWEEHWGYGRARDET
jgi:predicted GNAT superfamily acetyltransferase